jgi:signal transduction histidine kinase
MGSERHLVAVLAHLVAIAAAWAGVGRAWQRAESGTLLLLALLLLGGLIVSLVRLIRRHDRDLARFVEAIGHGDLTQRFGPGPVAAALDRATRRLRDERHVAGEDVRFQRALIEKTPVPLVTVDGDGIVRFLNQAARELFGAGDGRPIAEVLGTDSPLTEACRPATGRLGRALLSFDTATGHHRAIVTITEVIRAQAPLRLVAIAPIGGELDAAEVAAQADLVRVLTHEIMNSMTPVTSLARSAATLMARIPAPDDDVRDARRAIDIVADRAEGLLGFVGSYRRYATLPMVVRRRVDAADWARSVIALFGEASYGRGVAVALAVRPAGMAIDGDPDLLLQAVLNLLKNAAEAGAGRITLSIEGRADHVSIAVEDDGAGIAEDALADMFLPFFTSKPTGTGIGLSLARQVAVAHGGAIAAANGAGGGAVLRLNLPGQHP